MNEIVMSIAAIGFVGILLKRFWDSAELAKEINRKKQEHELEKYINGKKNEKSE